MPRLELERALRESGFTRIQDEPLFFFSLELRRPPLPAAPSSDVLGVLAVLARRKLPR